MARNIGRGAPNLQSLEQFKTSRPGKEVIWQPLYDIQTYAAAGVTSQAFFQVPVGQGGKTIQDTNMRLAGSLPAGESFLITGIEVQFFPAGTIETTAANSFADDEYLVRKAGSLVLTLFSKNYLEEAPLINFPSQTRLSGFAATNITSGTDGSMIEYASACGPLYEISPLEIPSNQNFVITLGFTAAVPVSANARIGVRLNGWKFRNSQ